MRHVQKKPQRNQPKDHRRNKGQTEQAPTPLPRDDRHPGARHEPGEDNPARLRESQRQRQTHYRRQEPTR